MCGSVSFGFTVSLGVTVVSRIRAPGSAAALLDAHPAARVLTSPAKSSRLMFTSRRLDMITAGFALRGRFLLSPDSPDAH
jgi:hypothetical protein